MKLSDLAALPLTYAEVGATAGVLPPDYRHVHRAAVIGHGRDRFEEAAAHRDAFTDLVRAVDRALRLRALAGAGRIELQTPDGTVVLDAGRLAGASEVHPAPVADDRGLALAEPGLGERHAVAAWLERAENIRLVSSEFPLAYPWPRAELLERIEL